MYERGGESGYDSYPKGTTHAPRCTHPNVIKWRISFNGPKSRCFKCVHLALGPDLHSGFLNGSPKGFWGYLDQVIFKLIHLLLMYLHLFHRFLLHLSEIQEDVLGVLKAGGRASHSFTSSSQGRVLHTYFWCSHFDRSRSMSCSSLF